MSKIWYHKTTGHGAVFDDDASLADWPDFQETQPDMAAINSVKVRSERDALLAASDSMALADRITDEWRTYRQALRDLPEAEGFPDVAFPTPPS
jgi:hypothetical protein